MKTEQEPSYEDMLELPHHVSKNHPQMAGIDRAAQFSPFAALTGYDSVIQDKIKQKEAYYEEKDIPGGVFPSSDDTFA